MGVFRTNDYAGNGLADGLARGIGLSSAYNQMKAQKGLASGMSKVANGDESGWNEIAEADPSSYLQYKMAKEKMANDLERERVQRTFNQPNEVKIWEYAQNLPDQQKNEFLQLRKAQNPSQTMTPYEKTIQQEQAKNDIEIKRGAEDFEKMKQSVLNALDRASVSLKSGSGIGPIAGKMTKYGLLGGKSAENYANIESANTQMNQILRAKLKATGLTGSELNSAVEANAYRYTISPLDNEAVVDKKIENFKQDVLLNGDNSFNKQQEQNDPLGIL